MKTYFFGAAGAGAATLGTAPAPALGRPHFDRADCCWGPFTGHMPGGGPPKLALKQAKNLTIKQLTTD